METRRSKKAEAESNEERHDPFAVDIFGKEPRVTQAGLKSVKAIALPEGVTRNWYENLELVPPVRNLASQDSPVYPEWLEIIVNNRLMPSLRTLAGKGEGPVHFEIISFEDAPAESLLARLCEAPNLFVRFEFGGEKGLISLSSELAGEIIDGVLSGPGNKAGDLRPLSKIELAICEYVAGSALSRLNMAMEGNSVLRIQNVANEVPGKEFSSMRMVEIVADLAVGKTTGMVSILLPFAMADSLESAFHSSTLKAVSVKESDIPKGLPEAIGIFLKVGSTQVPAVEIPFLESEDVVLVTEPAEAWWEGREDIGTLDCLVGASSNIRISGRASMNGTAGTLRFEVLKAVCDMASGNYSRIMEKSSKSGVKDVANKNPNAETDVDTGSVEDAVVDEHGAAENEAGLVALENVMVDLRVQVAGRKISLNDLGKIHAGQIIDLGCHPEDPVELIAESSDRPIAAGELVRIEDQLGVRITKVFV